MVESAIISTDAPSHDSSASNQRIVELRVSIAWDATLASRIDLTPILRLFVKVELPSFDRTVDDRGNEVVFYIVHVALGRRKWKLEKRFN